MTDTDIISLLKSFSKKEMYRFGNFLHSPYFNTNSAMQKLFIELRKCYPMFKSKKLNNKYMYNILFKDMSYKDATMRNLYFRLGTMLEKFLAVENLSVNEVYMDTRLLSEYNKRKQKKLFVKFLGNMENKMKEGGDMDIDYFHAKFLMEAEKFNFQSINRLRTKSSVLKYKINCVDNSSIYLTINYIREMLGFYMNQSIVLSKYNLKRNKTVVSELIKYLDIKAINKLFKNKNEHYFILELYYSLWQCYYNFSDEKYYYNYKAMIHEYLRKMGLDEISFHFSRLLSYCIIKMRMHQYAAGFGKEFLDVAEEFLIHGYYKNKKVDYIPHDLYRMILRQAIDSGRMKYAKNFIEKYTSKVEPQLRDRMYNFGNAYYFYYSGQYNKSLECLQDTILENFYFRYDARHLQIANNIELGNYDAAEVLIHEYMVSVDNNDMMTEELKKKHYNYLNLIGKLIKYLFGNDRIDPGFLRSKIKRNDKIVQNQWLIELCDKIISNRITRVFPQKSRLSRTA